MNDCLCHSHNGFLTRRGYEAMKGVLHSKGLTGLPSAARVDMPVSVSVSESEAEVTPQKDK